jgi:hypothetical protein
MNFFFFKYLGREHIVEMCVQAIGISTMDEKTINKTYAEMGRMANSSNDVAIWQNRSYKVV